MYGYFIINDRDNKKELNLSRMIKKIEAKIPKTISCTLS